MSAALRSSQSAVSSTVTDRSVALSVGQRRTHETAGLHTHLVLLAAPKARTFYPHIGMEPHDSAWTIPRKPWKE